MRLRLWLAAVFACLWTLGSGASAQLRIVTYNTLDKPTSSFDESQFQTIFSAIGTESVNGIARPVDILTLQEQELTSQNNTTEDMAAALNDLYSTTDYQALTIGSGTDRLSMVYNSATVQVLDNRFVVVGTRPGMRTQFRPVGYDDPAGDFYVYSVHLKAGRSSSDASTRASEVAKIREDADALGQGQSIVYTGDFNVTQGTELAYQNFFSAGNGSAVDPTGVSAWNGLTTPEIMTQSTRTGNLSDGGAGGGLDDRFDFQLVTDEVADGSGFAIISPSSTGAAESSYRAFGNDGTSFNQSINNSYTGRSQSAAVLDALFGFSDHLPVVADYQLPAQRSLELLATETRVFTGGASVLLATLENTAPVSVGNGADTLDYTVNAAGDVVSSDTFFDSLAVGDVPESYAWIFDTSTAGTKTATFDYDSLVDGVSDDQVQTVVTVLDRGTASFSAGAEQTVLSIDFGSFEFNDNNGLVGEGFSLFNLESTPGFTADLELGTWTLTSGDGDALRLLDLPGELVAGDSLGLLQVATLDTTEVGSFSATYDITLTDDSTIAGGLSSILTLNLIGEIVSALVLGDFNLDGQISGADIQPFVDALSDPDQYRADNGLSLSDFLAVADISQDGVLTGQDIQPFINLLGSSGSMLSTQQVGVLRTVPEPGTISFLLMASLMIQSRRRPFHSNQSSV